MAYVIGLTADSPFISLGKLGFVDIRDSLRDYFESSDVFTDYDFEGSALSTLIDLLSYNSTFYSYYTNMVANESFLDTAVKKSSLGSLVKPLSYVPISRRGARADINVSSTINKTIRYGDAIFGEGLNWTPIQTYNIVAGVTTKIGIIQGNLIETSPEQSIVDASIPHQRFRIPHQEIDITTLHVHVNEGSGFNKWTPIESIDGSISGVTAGDKVYFLTSSFDGGYEVYFGDNVVGKSPVHNSEVSFDYIISAGEKGNGIVSFTSAIPNITVDGTVVASHGGLNDESPDSIRTHAPLFFQAQGRAVTSNDFKSLLRQERKGIISKIWGGEDNDPPQYGRVFVSAMSETGELLTQDRKDDIINMFKSKAIVSIIPEFVDPKIIEIALRGRIGIDLSKTSASEAELFDLIVNFIDNYEFNGFENDFDWYRFWQELQSLDAGIAGEDVSSWLTSRFNASPTNPVNAITINYKNALANPLGTVGFVRSVAPFDATTDQGVQSVMLRDNGNGIMQLGTATNGQFGDLLSDNIGSVNYNNGRIQIDGVEFLSDFAIEAPSREKSVINQADSVLTVVNGGIFIDTSPV
ncbi:MAG: hypothetical protein H8D80_00890 [Proteobacteria bacterium]|nr:hypothetical protein [Pseudomonadota bacterium]